jgi:hypothetical protein
MPGSHTSKMPPPPSPAQEQIETVVARLKSRNVTDDYCPRCNTFDWSVDFIQMAAAPASAAVTAGYGGVITGFIPAVCFVCKNCGYMMFHKLDVLDKSEVRK